MDQTSAINDPETGIYVALKLNLYMDNVRGLMPQQLLNSAEATTNVGAASSASIQHQQVDTLSLLHTMKNDIKVSAHMYQYALHSLYVQLILG